MFSYTPLNILSSFFIQSFFANKRFLLPVILLICLASPPLHHISISSMSDAFFQVSIFVAATLFIYYFLIEKLPQLELTYLSTKSPLLELCFAAFLGALPGCGGAIIVVTQFTKGQASFGSVVAVLTATMGDAAFLLIATNPFDGLKMMCIGLLVGIISGYLTNMFHKRDFLVPPVKQTSDACNLNTNKAIVFSKSIWKVILVPSIIIAILMATNIDMGMFGITVNHLINIFGASMALFAVITWALSSKGQSYQEITGEEESPQPPSKVYKVLQDTHFVTAWVVASFMLFEILVKYTGIDLATWFSHFAYLAPLIGVIIGFLPGCGPQIVVTTLYIQGIIPFSALAANAISNDGDALFPAIAMAPKAAFVATLYSAIPALFIGYGLYFYGV
ncbi:putative manganese transporter [Pseudoalteromonas sp. H105]|uniref:putative manganese transporter n=1 Tax=Pseudoalteromonas sp. H105 TaxID=1348393 RepID=UPI0007322006|nr:putative manganese transporter [Pseudoalteromonas sp. H105]KTF18541.1 hypothetical protein ATS75_02465 [Pseudoalteromonas sp. H105]